MNINNEFSILSDLDPKIGWKGARDSFTVYTMHHPLGHGCKRGKKWGKQKFKTLKFFEKY